MIVNLGFVVQLDGQYSVTDLYDSLDTEDLKVDANGSFIVMAVNVLDDNFVIGNIYSPNTERDQLVFMEDLRQVLISIGASSDNKGILRGDWNIVQDVMKDKKGGRIEIKGKSVEK